MSGSDKHLQAGGETAGPEIEALLFDAASEFGTMDERNRFLNFACRGEPEMLKRILALIDMTSPADNFFEFEPQVETGDISQDGPPEEGLGVDVGRYRLIERLGAGGCGVVYLAEQREPVRRKVALKIIRLGTENPEAVARFEAERQALASLNHPNIARILDAGTTANGRSYYVMELVDGEAITTYCDSNRLDIRKRLSLFLEVCRAIQHAHQKSVVHRDIKPSNILIEGEKEAPTPKVIDFGISRHTGLLTDSWEPGGNGLMGTPVYMSPEQVAGDETVDTRSDIYSLGIVLSELLVGSSTHLPPDLMDRRVEEIREIIRSAAPDLPSKALASRNSQERSRIARDRDVREDRLQAWLRRDLDWVVMKATQRYPADRYETVEAIAADVIKWLHDEPVSARPQTRRYRLAKLVNRNRLWFGAGALAVVGLVGGLGVATLLFFRERDARAVQEKLRFQAEAAHQAEKEARTNWEYRSRVAESAVRLRYEDQTGAEELVAAIPLEGTPASLEAVSVYKELAEWHRNEGRMEEAEKYFLSMVYALSNTDRAHTDSNSDNFLPASAALALSTDPQRYASLRRIALELYGDTRIKLVAERTLKACLLKPASDAELQQMRKLADVIAESAATRGGIVTDNPSMGEWEYFALAMFHYRAGEFDRAESLAISGLAKRAFDPSCVFAEKAVLGLVLLWQGQRQHAMEYLRSIERDAGAKLRGNQPHGGSATGFWWDWANVRILLEEAGWSVDKGWGG